MTIARALAGAAVATIVAVAGGEFVDQRLRLRRAVLLPAGETPARLARFATSLGHKRAAILYENNAYGRGLTDAFRRSFPGEIISIDPITDAADQNFEPFVSFYKLRSPEIVFVAGTEASGMALLREAKRQSLNARFLGGDGWTGIVADTAAAEGAYVGAPFTDADTRQEVRRFVEASGARSIEVQSNDLLLTLMLYDCETADDALAIFGFDKSSDGGEYSDSS